jgi:hypothetical protein
VFTGPGGGPGHPGGPGVPPRDPHGAVPQQLPPHLPRRAGQARRPAGQLRPTARRTLRALRDGGPQRLDQLAARLTANGRRPVRPATVTVALRELHAVGLAAIDHGDQDGPEACWSVLPAARHPLLDAVDLHGAHDFRHTFSTWLEDAGIPARVIDELMGHGRSRRGELDGGSRIGLHYRHTTPEMPHERSPPSKADSQSSFRSPSRR